MHISSPYHPSKILRFVLRLMSSGVMSDTKVFVEAIDLEAAKLVDDAANLQESIGLEWENISYTTSDKDGMKKTLIHPMSGCAIPGEMLALMGTSGAGKSTLLDILAGRLVSKNLTGKILANKRPVNFNSFRKQSGYVMQSDALFPLLTVKETLYYAAHLRIQGKTYAEREAAAATTMRLLRLEHVQDTIVGDEQNRGLSGGEKRRVSIAVDIIHEPRVIFLDEPTSGLDSTTAVTVIEALKGIAVNRKSTLIVTIHQPSARLYALFDKCLFLSGGKVTYTGPSDGLQDYAAELYRLADMGKPPVANAPEVFLELCDELISNDKLSLAVIDTVAKVQIQKSNSKDSLLGEVEAISSQPILTVETANNYFYESFLLFMRNLTNIIRTKELFLARIGAVCGFGFLVGSLFYRRPETDVGVTERVAYLVFSIAFFCYTSLESLPIFLAEREIFQREYSRGAYRAFSYVTAVTLVYIPFLLILGLFFAIASWWLVMLPNEAETFFFDIFILLCTNIAAQAFAVLISVIVPDPMAGQSAGAGLFSVMFLLSGFFIKKDNIPVWWQWLHYLSLFKYSYESMVINVLAHKMETPTSTNEELLIMFSVNDISKWRGVGVLLGFSIFYRLIFYYVLMTKFNGRRKE